MAPLVASSQRHQGRIDPVRKLDQLTVADAQARIQIENTISCLRNQLWRHQRLSVNQLVKAVDRYISG